MGCVTDEYGHMGEGMGIWDGTICVWVFRLVAFGLAAK